MIKQLVVAGTLLTLSLAPRPAAAHCDTTKGPVITAAREALDRGDPALVLHWVRADDEPAIRAAFAQTMAVRTLGPEAQELADRAFFETLVRIHRAGEGAPYTGITDEDPEPIIALTDRALAAGSPAELEATLVAAVKEGLAHRFAAASTARAFAPGDVTGGRAYVAAYVPLAHWVEAIQTIAAEGEAHGAAGGGAAAHDQHAAAAATHREHTGGSHLAHLPWILAILFGLSTAVLGTLQLSRRRAAV